MKEYRIIESKCDQVDSKRYFIQVRKVWESSLGNFLGYLFGGSKWKDWSHSHIPGLRRQLFNTIGDAQKVVNSKIMEEIELIHNEKKLHAFDKITYTEKVVSGLTTKQ